MVLEPVESLEEFLIKNPNAVALNFSDNLLNRDSNIETIVVGCEGGFTPREIEFFGENIIGLDSSLILKSESAVCVVASKTLL
jgi:16S rRNA (uracil1498-N3)-methyltransferase